MIYFEFNLELQHLIKWKKLWEKNLGYITKNKYVEMELMRDNSLLSLEIDTSWKGRSHAGPRLSIALLTIRFDILIVDYRHWNHETESWIECTPTSPCIECQQIEAR